MLEELEDDIDAVSARLKRARLILGFEKKTDFADYVGISKQAYGAFENGNRDLTLHAAKKLRKKFGLTLEFLYFGRTDDLPSRIARELSPRNVPE
ncbi:helix-turn-helix domain-containing protein [Epibacterium sp. SM1969]|uniref:Helix-turn-helix domain-containing protein n=1 Tax=Tritonibacter aquimaris TaxID=2663379 RepID=A0A844AU10_9RHOB|nr:helix-turn-helix domain-containing protein [Tritonibacter aquimaris]